jgi:hypothetical protein
MRDFLPVGLAAEFALRPFFAAENVMKCLEARY